MKAKIIGTKIEFDLYELIEDMDADARLQLADAVAVRDDVIMYVVQQILDGVTDHDSWAGTNCVANGKPYHGMDWACREVSKRAGEVAVKEIVRLEKALIVKEEEAEHLRKLLEERQYGR